MSDIDAMPVPGLAPRFTLRMLARDTLEIGRLATGGTRRQRQFGGGTFAGPEISGTLISGSETLLDRPDGVTIVEAGYLVRVETGEVIRLIGTGFAIADEGFRGMRLTIVFEADEDGPLARLATRAFLAERCDGDDTLSIVEIL